MAHSLVVICTENPTDMNLMKHPSFHWRALIVFPDVCVMCAAPLDDCNRSGWFL
jgi:hypothetical protein